MAESCTAGLAADFIARNSGASKVFWGSFVVYTLDAKQKMLGISEELLGKHGAVSREAALAMAEGALKKSGVDWAFSVTGLAGPGGDDSVLSRGNPAGIPIGTIWIGIAARNGLRHAKMFLFEGNRNDVREAAATAAIEEFSGQILTEWR